MADSHPLLLAALAGFVCALVFASIPVGPINLTILNEGAQRGFRWAIFIGLGAAVMDAIYCAISFTGLSGFFDHGIVKASMQAAIMISKFHSASTGSAYFQLSTSPCSVMRISPEKSPTG